VIAGNVEIGISLRQRDMSGIRGAALLETLSATRIFAKEELRRNQLAKTRLCRGWRPLWPRPPNLSFLEIASR